jgi:hypothetical protein
MQVYEHLDKLVKLSLHGHVCKNVHPEKKLIIYHHSLKAKKIFSDVTSWPPVLRDARGLVLEADTGRVVLRGFQVFEKLNFDQVEEYVKVNPGVYISEKLDGVQIQVGRYGDEILVTTKQSFISKYISLAKKLLPTNFRPVPGFTYCFELIHPKSLSIIDYGEREELVLLDVIENKTGRGLIFEDSDISLTWPGTRAKCYQLSYLHKALAAGKRFLLGEGFVLYNPKTKTRLKLKYPLYQQIHRLYWSDSDIPLWKAAQDCGELIQVLRNSDVLRKEIKTILEEQLKYFCDRARQKNEDLIKIFNEIINHNNEFLKNREKFVAYVKKNIPSPYQEFMFDFFTGKNEGKNFKQRLWNLVKPIF